MRPISQPTAAAARRARIAPISAAIDPMTMNLKKPTITSKKSMGGNPQGINTHAPEAWVETPRTPGAWVLSSSLVPLCDAGEPAVELFQLLAVHVS